MKLLTQELYAVPRSENEGAFNRKDVYHYNHLQQSIMNATKALIGGVPYPVFIIDGQECCIVAENEAAKTAKNNSSLIGEKIDDVVYNLELQSNGEPLTLAFFNKQWYQLKQRLFEWEGTELLIMELQPRPGIPDAAALESWKEMIALMLHRFRSPLTGITGYLDMMDDEIENAHHKKWLNNINKGIDHLYDMMDELEKLYNIPSNYDDTDSENVVALEVIREVILEYPEAKDSFFEITGDKEAAFSCNPTSLRRVLQMLIHNSVEYSDPEAQSIQIRLIPGSGIEITNGGKAIPDELCKALFKPFTTSRADNLGIGLTMALLYAKQFGGTILNTRNEDGAIAFRLLFPVHK